MKYPVVIHHDLGSAYGVTVPDISGCFSAGETVDEALENTQEAISGHLELLAEDGGIAPPPSAIETLQANPDYAGGVWAYVDIDITPFEVVEDFMPQWRTPIKIKHVSVDVNGELCSTEKKMRYGGLDDNGNSVWLDDDMQEAKP